MIHPSYVELMKVVNNTTEVGEEPVVNSRYSIVIAAAKRARQLIAGDEPLVAHANGKKPLSTAVQELYEGKVKILGEDEAADEAQEDTAADTAEVSAEETATTQAEE
ncbi:MAG: DNA-directed RNA polymerase subunit omega [Eubacterium sp.]|nr:DNA-directed RNA polymerase subunit omega [Eubacterium sp.]